MREIPEHLRQISLGEEIESMSYEEIDRNFIPQVGGTLDSRDSLDQTPDSIDLTESPVKIDEDTSDDDDTDEMSDFDKDRARKIYRKDINKQRQRANIIKSKKGRTTKIYAINIERKKLLKQRREKVLQNAKDRKLTRANKASSDTQNTTNTDAAIGNANTNAAKDADNIDNVAKDAENMDNDVINGENTDNAPINADNTSNAATDGEKSDNVTTNGEKSDDAAMGDDNTDNAAMSDNNTDEATIGDGNTENTITGKTTMVDVPSPLCYGRKTKDPSKVKTSKRCIHIMVEPSIGDPLPNEITTVTMSGHAFDPTDVCIYEFSIQGAPNLLDLEGIEEDQLLEIQQNIQDKLKQRDEERERNITKRMKQYVEKYDFINKALLESVAQITEMTKTDHPLAAARV